MTAPATVMTPAQIDTFAERLPPLKWSKYIPVEPTARQAAGLLLPKRELMYGGAAGGGNLSCNGWSDATTIGLILTEEGTFTVLSCGSRTGVACCLPFED